MVIFLVKIAVLIILGIILVTVGMFTYDYFVTYRVKVNIAYYIKDNHGNNMMFVQSITKILDFGYEIHVLLSDKDGKITERKYMAQRDFSKCLPYDGITIENYASKCTKEQFLGYIRAYITHPYGVDK